MLEYELLREFFLLLKVKSTPLKHWSNYSGWQIANTVQGVVLSKAMSIISKVNYVVVSVDEVTTINGLKWISIHAYMMKNCKHVPILLTLEKVEVGVTLDSIKAIILNAMGKYGVLAMKPWSPSGVALDVMVTMCSQAFKLG